MKKVIPILLILFVLAQLIRIDKSVPTTDAQADLFAMNQAPDDIKAMVKGACYDCHSYETTYPSYTNVAPLSWWIKGHIKNGRGNTNFSEWGNYDAEKRRRKAGESAEKIELIHMPPKSYRFMHSEEAQFTDAQRQQLVGWFKSLVK